MLKTGDCRANPPSYSPVGRGMLTGAFKSPSDLPEGDFRHNIPRFQSENFDNNFQLVKKIEDLAQQKKCTSAQLALGWVISLSKQPGMPKIIPIPGTNSVERVKENADAVELSDEEMEQIKSILDSIEIKGDRYHAAGMTMVNG